MWEGFRIQGLLIWGLKVENSFLTFTNLKMEVRAEEKTYAKSKKCKKYFHAFEQVACFLL